MKFLLENEYTTIKDELDAAARYACQFAFLLPKTYCLEPDAVVEYLLQSPEYRPVCVRMVRINYVLNLIIPTD